MPIRFYCHQCQAKIRVPDGAEGRKIKCPRCGTSQRVPAESEPDRVHQDGGPHEPGPPRSRVADLLKMTPDATDQAETADAGLMGEEADNPLAALAAAAEAAQTTPAPHPPAAPETPPTHAPPASHPQSPARPHPMPQPRPRPPARPTGAPPITPAPAPPTLPEPDRAESITLETPPESAAPPPAPPMASEASAETAAPPSTTTPSAAAVAPAPIPPAILPTETTVQSQTIGPPEAVPAAASAVSATDDEPAPVAAESDAAASPVSPESPAPDKSGLHGLSPAPAPGFPASQIEPRSFPTPQPAGAGAAPRLSAVPRPIPLSTHPTAHRPTAKPIPLTDQPGSIIRPSAKVPVPAYPLLWMAVWLLRGFAALGVVTSLSYTVFVAVRGRALAADWLYLAGGLAASAVLFGLAEGLHALRDMARNSFR